MDKLEILCRKDSDLMREFSKRAFRRFTGHSALSLHLPVISGYLEANVVKEVEKDALIIEHAVEAFEAGAALSELPVDALFEKTKTVDRAFIKRLLIPSLTIKVHYEDIAEVRKKRIRHLSGAVYSLLRNWKGPLSFEEAVRLTYSESQYREVLEEVLHLYSLETRLLGSSIHFFPPFNRALNDFAETLSDAMEQIAEEMSRECAATIFGQERVPCPNPI